MRKPGYLEVSTVETFASDLRYITERQPERFARFALKLPNDAPAPFLYAIVSGLHTSTPPNGLTEEEKKHWQPASHETLEKVLHLLMSRDEMKREEITPAKDVCWLLNHHAGHPWAADIVALLAWIATEHIDPEPEHFPEKLQIRRHTHRIAWKLTP